MRVCFANHAMLALCIASFLCTWPSTNASFGRRDHDQIVVLPLPRIRCRCRYPSRDRPTRNGCRRAACPRQSGERDGPLSRPPPLHCLQWPRGCRQTASCPVRHDPDTTVALSPSLRRHSDDPTQGLPPCAVIAGDLMGVSDCTALASPSGRQRCYISSLLHSPELVPASKR